MFIDSFVMLEASHTKRREKFEISREWQRSRKYCLHYCLSTFLSCWKHPTQNEEKNLRFLQNDKGVESVCSITFNDSFVMLEASHTKWRKQSLRFLRNDKAIESIGCITFFNDFFVMLKASQIKSRKQSLKFLQNDKGVESIVCIIV